MPDAKFWIPSDFVPIRDPQVPRIECNTPQKSPRSWRASARVENREKTAVFDAKMCANFPADFLTFVGPDQPDTCKRRRPDHFQCPCYRLSLERKGLNICQEKRTFLSQYLSSKSQELSDTCSQLWFHGRNRGLHFAKKRTFPC